MHAGSLCKTILTRRSLDSYCSQKSNCSSTQLTISMKPGTAKEPPAICIDRKKFVLKKLFVIPNDFCAGIHHILISLAMTFCVSDISSAAKIS